MEQNNYIQKIQQKIDEAGAWGSEVTDFSSPKYQIWESLTLRILKDCLPGDMLNVFNRPKITSCMYPQRSRQLFVKHIANQVEALRNFIEVLKNEAMPDTKESKEKSPATAVNSGTLADKKRTRKTSFGFNAGVFKGSIEEEREI